jgi:hypothetical protein
MLKNKNLAGALLLVAGVMNSPLAAAFFGDMMNPSRWFGGDRDYHDDYYYDGPRGPGYGPGYYGGPAGYAAPGYPPPGYAAPPAYGYAAPVHPAPPAHSRPAARDDAASSEISKLKQRIEQLEQERAASSMAGQGHFSQPGYAPAGAAAPHNTYTPPPVRPLTPETTADMAGHGGPATTQAAPAQPAGKPQAPAGEWRPSGYFHPAMQ